ncbi:MAG: DNA-3-methyladenine glycosylase [Oscillospiraceae bacterium]
MRCSERDGEVELFGLDDFDLQKIFECGQCFRWNRRDDGSYIGVAMGRAARLRRDGDSIFISGTAGDFENIWYDYFDFSRNYAEIRRIIATDDYMRRATEYGAGIRILNQDRWETLCSFIISQCNNIPRIKKIVEKLCALFGEPLDFCGDTYYTFPPAEKLAALNEADLSPLRSGYRAPYILGAARAVADGRLDLDALSGGSYADAMRELKLLSGIGDKVANCAILFSLRMKDAFPVDVHMKRAIAEHYGKSFDPRVFGDLAGVAQQYMFYYQRTKNVLDMRASACKKLHFSTKTGG